MSQIVNTSAPAEIDHEFYVFDAEDLLREAIKANEAMKSQIRTDIISLTQFFSGAGRTIRQIKLLGVMGNAYHKIGANGRKYIIFKGNQHLRPDLRGTRYLASNPKVAAFVVGSRDIIKDAGKGLKIAVVLLVAIDIVREFQEERFSFARLGVSILSDILQAAGATAVGVVAGVILGVVGAPVVVTFAIVVGVSLLAGIGFSKIDSDYKLTERASATMMQYEEELRRKAGLISGALREAAELAATARQLAATVNRYYQMAEELRRLPILRLPQLPTLPWR